MTKQMRLETILEILHQESAPCTLEKILKRLKALGLKVTSSCLKKDLAQLLQAELIYHNEPCPESYSVRPGVEFNFKLSNEEATYLMVVLPESHPINQRLKKMMGLF